MSLKALTWAIEQKVYSSPQKFVLVALANFANEENHAYPSVSTICGITMQKDETVRSALAALAEQGFISDTGQRYGHTQQVKVWQLNVKTAENGGLEAPPKDSPKDPPKTPPKTPEKGEQSFEPVNRKPVKPKPEKLSDEDFLKSLKELYKWINVDCEIDRMKAWLLTRPGRQLSRKFIVNWLNRIEKPLGFSETPAKPTGTPILKKHIYTFTPETPPTREMCGGDWEMYYSDWKRWKDSL